MTPEQLIALAPALEAEQAKRAAYKAHRYFPDEGPYRRELYGKFLQFFRAGTVHQERTILGGNRVGKTDAAAFEIRCHLTGLYPPWWEGRRFDRPTRWWAAGDTMETSRNVIQVALLGPHDGVNNRQWTGMLDAHLVVDVTRKSGGIANCIDTIWVQHVEKHHGAPALSSCQIKSYDQGRRSFQGTELDGVWLDEEPPDDSHETGTASGGIYTECLMRLMTTNGLMIATFTPLRGLTPFLAQYLETAQMAGDDGTEQSAARVFWPAGA